MFRPIERQATRPSVVLQLDGRPVHAFEGDTLAVALLQAGITRFRDTPVSASPRGPLCLMGVCFDCLVEVDGVPNVQACMVPVRAGMRVRLQQGARHAEAAP